MNGQGRRPTLLISDLPFPPGPTPGTDIISAGDHEPLEQGWGHSARGSYKAQEIIRSGPAEALG